MILNTKMRIPNEVFEHFAAEPASPLFSVSRVADGVRAPIHGALNALLAEVPPSAVDMVLADPQFQFFAQAGDASRQARIWFIEHLLMDEIPRRKLALLRAERRSARPRPYDIPALADLDPDDDHLVPLSAFECDGARLLSHGSPDPRQASALQIATNRLFDNPDRSHIHSIVYRGARGILRQSVSVGKNRVDRSYQEQGPTYFFKNPNHTLTDDRRYSLFATS